MPIFATLFLGLSSVATAAPTVQDGTVLRPHFTTQEGSHSAGTAFAIDVEDTLLVVTALHLFGPAGGLKGQIDGDKIAEFTTSVTLRDAFTGGDFGQANKALSLTNTQPMGDEAAGDIVAFEAQVLTGLDKLNAKSKDLVPLSLAAKVPQKGDSVYVAAQVGADKDSRVHKATVVESNDKWLFYEYADSALDIAGTNGAPVLNEAGKVIGMNLGGGKMDDGKLIGSANPLNPIQQRLTEAVTRE
jgi:hypothetical protein